MRAEEEGAGAVRRGADAPAPARRPMPDDGYKRLFVSLIDPTAMARTGRCMKIANRIAAYSAGAGWEQGSRTAGLFGEVYADMSEMLDRPVADGSLGHATAAVRDTLEYLRRFGRSYRDGTPPGPRRYLFCADKDELAARREEGDLDPVRALENLRSRVAALREEASRIEGEDGGADGGGEDGPQGPRRPPGPEGPKRPPWTCRHALMRSEWRVRQRLGKGGLDHVFPPAAEGIVGMLSGCAVPGMSSLDMVREVRGTRGVAEAAEAAEARGAGGGGGGAGPPPGPTGDPAGRWPVLDRERRVYADTGLFVAAMMGPSDPFYADAVRFLDAAERAGAVLVFSNLSLMEAADLVLRSAEMRLWHLGAEGGGAAPGRREEEEAMAAAAADAARLVRFVDAGLALKQIEPLEDAAAAAVDFRRLFKKALGMPGRTPADGEGGTYRHEGAAPVCMVHAAQAQAAGARAVCTPDGTLARLGGAALYGGMDVVVLRPRPGAGAGR